MLRKTLLTVGLGLSLTMAASVQAAPTNVHGVIIDPDAPSDLTIRSDTMTQDFGSLPLLSGFGLITNLNTTNAGVFCPGCELTFTYSGYSQTAGSLVPPLAEFNGGMVNIYRDVSQDFVGNGTFAQASNGVLWLSLTGHEITSVLGGVDSTLFVSAPPSGATGTGFLDVAGGAAAAYFDTNTVGGTGNTNADFDFQNSFTGTSGFTLGSGNVSGDTQVPVSEPESLVLLGIGLLGAIAVRRRKL